MKNKSIAEMLSHLTTLTNSWEGTSHVPAIERDIVLEELRALYEVVMNIGLEKKEIAATPVVEIVAESTPKTIVEEVAEKIAEPAEAEVEVEEPAAEAVTNSIMDSFDDALDIDALLGLPPSVEEVSVEPDVAAEPKIEIEAATVEPTPEVEPEVVEEAVVEVEPMAEEMILSEVATKEVSKVVTEVVAQTKPEPVAESAPAMVSESLFGIEDIPVRSKSSRRMISLYNTPTTPEKSEPTPAKSTTTATPKSRNVASIYEPQPTPIEEVEAVLGSSDEKAAPAPAVVEEITPQPVVATTINDAATTRLGDVLGGKVTVLGDKLAAEEQPTTPFNRISDLRKAIGINDKFLMVRDLFEGDSDRYEATIETLNEFEDLDECMIYIVENFAWNPDSEGAKLLISLLERKLS